MEIISCGNIKKEVNKANRLAGCRNDTIWRKYLQKETKVRIYKAIVRPIMTYIAETRPDTEKIRDMLEIAEIKMLRRITGKPLLDQVETSMN